MTNRKKTLGFAIIGCGRVAPRHAEAINQIKNTKLKMVCDNVEKKALKFAKTYKAEPVFDYRTILQRPDIDVVDICLPNYLHAPVGIETARAHKHVLTEKPMATTLKDAENLIKACQQSGVKLSVVLQNRYNPPMQDLKKLVSTGRLGKILLGSVVLRWYRDLNYYQDEWHGGLFKTGGGALMTQAIHHIDALQWLMGMPETVYAYSGSLAHKIKVEDVLVAVAKFKNGALATIEASTVAYPEDLEASIAIFGKRGSVKVGGRALNQKVFWQVGKNATAKKRLTERDFEPVNVYGVNHRAVIEDMVKAIINNSEPFTNGHEALQSLKLVLAFYQSAKDKREVKIR